MMAGWTKTKLNHYWGMILAKHLTKSDIEKILSIIDGWEGKITWDALCDSVSSHVGKRPTRQSLNSHNQIKLAFKHKKKRLKNEPQQLRQPLSLKIASQRIKRLEEQNARLKKENDTLLEQFVKWQYNAYKYGMKEHQLNELLPKIDREN